MPTLTLELPPRGEQTAFNLRRWEEILANPDLQKVAGRVETDRHGRIIMSPPPVPRHGDLQFRIGSLLEKLMPPGRIITECPVSTADGVKGVDVAWASPECWGDLGNRAFFIKAPEICVEVSSPSNSEEELHEKMALYFDAGAKEVWLCRVFGAMEFFAPGGVALARSEICPTFPAHIQV